MWLIKLKIYVGFGARVFYTWDLFGLRGGGRDSGGAVENGKGTMTWHKKNFRCQ